MDLIEKLWRIKHIDRDFGAARGLEAELVHQRPNGYGLKVIVSEKPIAAVMTDDGSPNPFE